MEDDKTQGASSGPEAAQSNSAPTKKPVRPVKKDRPREFFRPENEDDDGYDPYSDRRPVQSMWEEDPWR